MKQVLEYLEKNDKNKTAVICENESITYGELISKSKLVGSNLINKVKINEPVIVFMDKGITTLEVFFGILYSGGCYSLVNPEFPQNRIKSILDEEDIDLINLYKSDDRTRKVVIRYITFVKKYKRYPLTTATDEEEKELLNDYTRNELYFSEADKKLINNLKKVVSSKEAMQNAYTEMLKQKKRR